MAKFVLYFDFESPYSFDYQPMEAKTIEVAIEEADKKWYKTNKDKPVYLVRIMKKVGKTVKSQTDGNSYETYEAILCKRSTYWHKNIKENCEERHTILKCWRNSGRQDFWFECE